MQFAILYEMTRMKKNLFRYYCKEEYTQIRFLVRHSQWLIRVITKVDQHFLWNCFTMNDIVDKYLINAVFIKQH